MAIVNKVVWASLDPVRNKIDFYPKSIAERIEHAYKNYIMSSRRSNNFCKLGSDFFNATVYFPKSNNFEKFYQTTPGIMFGRVGFKQPGYRSVIRLDVSQDNKYLIYTMKIENEPRIILDSSISERDYSGNVPNENVINIDYLADITEIISYWLPKDLLEENLEKNIIVWQWCLGTIEKQGNLLKLSEEWWTPYFHEQNKEIEDAFKNEMVNKVKIDVQHMNNEKEIIFTNDSAFAYQIDINTGKIREVKRTIMTVKDLKNKLENVNKIPFDISSLNEILDNEMIPFDFICSISHNIMIDPVKTDDGMIYDRESIEKWFEYRQTSPLTGLELPTKKLVSCNELKKNIEKYLINKEKSKIKKKIYI